MASKKYKTEQEVVIQLLSNKEIKDYDPPIVSSTKIKNFSSPSDNPNGQDGRKSKNNTCISMVNEFLGVGGFSKVFKFKKDEKNKAVKKIMSNPKIYSTKLTIVDSVKREVFGMIKCACKHTVKLYEVYQNEAGDNFFLLMELCKGNLEHLITALGRPLKTCEIKEILNQLNEVFLKLYFHNIIHRDIKPTNILFVEEQKNDENTNNEDNNNNNENKDLPFNGKKLIFKLTDFGVCLPLYSNSFSCGQFMGTLDFMAPEIYDKRSSIEQPKYTTKIDLFSLGESILNLMGFIKKAKPLDVKAIAQLRKDNTLFDGDYEDQLLADLIFNCLLVPDPDDRVNWDLYFLHPFFEKSEEERQALNNNNDDYYDNDDYKDEEIEPQLD
jgi:serine/threonine protein kinase